MRKESRSSFEIILLNDRAKFGQAITNAIKSFNSKLDLFLLTFFQPLYSNEREREIVETEKSFSVHYKYFSIPLSRVSDRIMHNVEKDIFGRTLRKLIPVVSRSRGPSVGMLLFDHHIIVTKVYDSRGER